MLNILLRKYGRDRGSPIFCRNFYNFGTRALRQFISFKEREKALPFISISNRKLGKVSSVLSLLSFLRVIMYDMMHSLHKDRVSNLTSKVKRKRDDRHRPIRICRFIRAFLRRLFAIFCFHWFYRCLALRLENATLCTR